MMGAVLSEPSGATGHTRMPTELLRRIYSEIDEMRRNWMSPDEFAEILRKITGKGQGAQP